MELVIWGLVSGFLTSAVVAWFPPSWEYAPGIILGVTIAGYFAREVIAARSTSTWGKLIAYLELLSFTGLSFSAYYLSLVEAQWVLGTNGFADFASYHAAAAESALFVAIFVGGCIGALLLAVGMRVLFFKFDLIRGMFIFILFSGALGSIVAVGFELFGFYPEFLFPVWHVGMAILINYIHKMDSDEKPPASSTT